MHPDELDRLFSRYLDGTINSEEAAQLSSAVARDPAIARAFAEWCLMQRQVVDVLCEDKFHDLIDQMLVARPGLPGEMSRRIDGGARATAPDHSPGKALWRWAALGGGLLAAAILLMLLWAPFSGPQVATVDPAVGDSSANTADGSADDAPAAIGSLTELIDATWKPEAEQYKPGEALKVGSFIRLSEGYAKLTFNCGAEVVLEGPCDFELHDRMVGLLHAGRLTANAPRRAFGFAVLCPGVDLVDLGTSFGVNVDETGATELHVFEGEVLSSPNRPNADGTRQVFHVLKDEAKAFVQDESLATDISIDRKKFEGLLSIRRPKEGTGELGPTDDLALWLAADGHLTVDDQRRVVCWHDLLCGENTSAEDALQPVAEDRPLWEPTAINGKPAIRFDGASDFLLTTALETTDNQTVFLVCQFSDNAFSSDRIYGGQILNYDGPPTRELTSTLAPGVLQIGEPLLQEEFRPALVTAQVFAGFVGKTTIEAGRIDAAPVGPNEPMIVAYHYDHSHGVATLTLNGQVAGTAKAFAPAGLTSRKVIGRHAWMELFFHGELAELIIYNAALPAEQVQAASAYLADKYDIQLKGAPAQ